MKINLIVVGKTSEDYLKQGVQDYLKRLGHYIKIETVEIIPDKKIKKLDAEQQKEREGEDILTKIEPGSLVCLLDENGKNIRSDDFSEFIQKRLNSGTKTLYFIIGGAFGVSESVKNKADFTLALSKMTFSHQMVRLIFMEQLYRAFTIIKNEPYHHR